MMLTPLLVLIAAWLAISGFSSPSCSPPTDRPFGSAPEKLNPAEWDGYWCEYSNDTECACAFYYVDAEQNGMIWMDAFGAEENVENGIGAITLRRVGKREKWWFLFPVFFCDETKCYSRGFFSPTADNSECAEFQEWYLIQKQGPTVQLWWDVSEQAMEDAFLNGEIPGELLSESATGGWKYRLLGSNLDAEEADKLLTGGYFVLEEDGKSITAPGTYVRYDSLPACAE